MSCCLITTVVPYVYLPEADALEAEFVADVNEVIGLQQTDDITTQGPLYTVEPWGVFSSV